MSQQIPTVTRLPIEPGTRVVADGFSYGEATFVGFSDGFSCPDTHIFWPGCRIAYVDMDRYGRQPVWESNLRVDGQPIYVAAREARS
jgi:hypothetical protein